jgi:hypothetical protein
LSHPNTTENVPSVVLSTMTHKILNMSIELCEQMMTALYPRPTPSVCSGVEAGAERLHSAKQQT